jgi:hypothetical protein
MMSSSTLTISVFGGVRQSIVLTLHGAGVCTVTPAMSTEAETKRVVGILCVALEMTAPQFRMLQHQAFMFPHKHKLFGTGIPLLVQTATNGTR